MTNQLFATPRLNGRQAVTTEPMPTDDHPQNQADVLRHVSLLLLNMPADPRAGRFYYAISSVQMGIYEPGDESKQRQICMEAVATYAPEYPAAFGALWLFDDSQFAVYGVLSKGAKPGTYYRILVDLQTGEIRHTCPATSKCWHRTEVEELHATRTAKPKSELRKRIESLYYGAMNQADLEARVQADTDFAAARRELEAMGL